MYVIAFTLFNVYNCYSLPAKLDFVKHMNVSVNRLICIFMASNVSVLPFVEPKIPLNCVGGG